MGSLLLGLLALPGLLFASPILDEPIIGGRMLVAESGEVTAIFLGSHAGYFNSLHLQTPDNALGTIFNKNTDVGSTVSLGAFAADTELLGLMHSGQLSESKVGQYLQTLKSRFSGEVVVDLLCYLRLHVELSLRAKGELMMRESGFRSPIDPEIKAKFEEMKYLEKSIGRTGRFAIMPVLRWSSRDLWQLHMLGSSDQ